MADPLGSAGAKDPEAPTINIRKCRLRTPWEVPKLKIQERPPPTLRNIDDGSWEALELEFRERPPSTLENIDGGPPGS
jgi:hypothetical protein